MSESKLTVAELMARAGKGEQPSGASRRRRRRSLEEGGISVAELTGSIPAVKEKPVESKHSAVKIDDPATPEKPKPAETPAAKQPEAQAATPTEVKTEAKTGAKAESQAAVKPEAKPAAKTTAPAAPAAKPVAKPEAKSDAKPAAKAAAPAAPAAKPAAASAEKPATPKPVTPQPAGPQAKQPKLTPVETAKTADKSKPALKPAAPAAAKPVAKPVAKTTTAAAAAKTVQAAKQEGKPTLQAVDKQQAQQNVKAAKPAEKADQAATAEQSAGKSTPSNEETMVLSIVDEKDPIRLTTGAFPVVPAAAVKPLAPKTDPAVSKDAETAADAEFAKGKSIDQAAEFPADTTQLDAVTGDMEAASGDTDEEDAEQSTKTSVFSIILMAIVGVVLGAVIFLAFEMLWERLNNWLVALLAIAVTLGMVGLVHALRTSRDGFSMILAGVVGLVMTFGPLLIVF